MYKSRYKAQIGSEPHLLASHRSQTEILSQEAQVDENKKVKGESREKAVDDQQVQIYS